jgi:hypothetical protein
LPVKLFTRCRAAVSPWRQTAVVLMLATAALAVLAPASHATAMRGHSGYAMGTGCVPPDGNPCDPLPTNVCANPAGTACTVYFNTVRRPWVRHTHQAPFADQTTLSGEATDSSASANCVITSLPGDTCFLHYIQNRGLSTVKYYYTELGVGPGVIYKSTTCNPPSPQLGCAEGWAGYPGSDGISDSWGVSGPHIRAVEAF